MDINDYRKITDLVFVFTKEWNLSFTVELIKYDEKGKHSFHNEYGYNTKNGHEISIKRQYNYYLSIDNTKKDNNGYKVSQRIYQNDMYFLLYKLNIVEKWFIDPNQEVFASKNNHIIIPKKQQFFERVNLLFGYLEFEPAILKFSGEEIIGVRIYVNSDILCFHMSIDRFLSFLYCIRSFNMFQSAQMMINYIYSSRCGMMNYNDINNMVHTRKLNEDNYFLDNNVPKGKSNKSFFEAVNATKRSE